MFFQYNPNFVFPSYDLKNYLDVLEIIVRRALVSPIVVSNLIGHPINVAPSPSYI